MADQCRVRCRVKPGVFEDEMVVRLTIVDSEGHEFEAQCLAYGDSIAAKGSPDANGERDATLRAYCLERRDDVAVIVLPQSTFQNGPNVLVKPSDLVE